MTNGNVSRQDDHVLTRRAFLGRAWLLMGAVVAGEATFLGLRYVGSRKTDSPFGSIIDAGRPDDYLPGTITAFPQARFFLVRFDDGGFLALYTRCTHLACLVAWDEEEVHFNCPCHGSRFDRQGDVLNTPAPRPLDRFPITLSTRKIEVDTGNPIQRQDVNLDDVTYLDEA